MLDVYRNSEVFLQGQSPKNLRDGSSLLYCKCIVWLWVFEARCPDSFEIWVESSVYVDELGTIEMCLNLDVFHVFTRTGVLQGVSKSRNTLLSKRD